MHSGKAQFLAYGILVVTLHLCADYTQVLNESVSGIINRKTVEPFGLGVKPESERRLLIFRDAVLRLPFGEAGE